MPPPWLLVKVEFCERAMQLIEILEYFKGWSLNAPPEFKGIKTRHWVAMRRALVPECAPRI